MGIYTPRQAPLSGISPPWGAQTRTQHTGAEQRGRITPPDLLWMHCLMQPRKSLSLFSQQGRVAGSCSICFPPGHPQDLPCRDFFPFFFLPPGAAVHILCSVVPAVERREMVLLPQARPGMLAAPPPCPCAAQSKGGSEEPGGVAQPGCSSWFSARFQSAGGKRDG